MRKKRRKSKKSEFDTLVIVEDHDISEDFRKARDLELRISSFDKATKSLKIAIKKSADAERNWKLEKERIIKEIEERGRKFKKIKKKQKKFLKNNLNLADMLAQRKTDELIRKKLGENAKKEAEVESIKKKLKKELLEEINAA